MIGQGCPGLLREVFGLSWLCILQTLSDAAFLVWSMSMSMSLPRLSRAAMLPFSLDIGGAFPVSAWMTPVLRSCKGCEEVRRAGPIYGFPPLLLLSWDLARSGCFYLKKLRSSCGMFAEVSELGSCRSASCYGFPKKKKAQKTPQNPPTKNKQAREREGEKERSPDFSFCVLLKTRWVSPQV